jgi:hypothetical protein
LLEEAKRKEKELAKEKEMQQELASKLKAMESKLLIGGKNINDHTNEQERRLEEKRYLSCVNVDSISRFLYLKVV